MLILVTLLSTGHCYWNWRVRERTLHNLIVHPPVRSLRVVIPVPANPLGGILARLGDRHLGVVHHRRGSAPPVDVVVVLAAMPAARHERMLEACKSRHGPSAGASISSNIRRAKSYRASLLGLSAYTSRCRRRRRWTRHEGSASLAASRFPWALNWTGEPLRWTELRSRHGRPQVPVEGTGQEHKAGNRKDLCCGSKRISHPARRQPARTQSKISSSFVAHGVVQATYVTFITSVNLVRMSGMVALTSSVVMLLT